MIVVNSHDSPYGFAISGNGLAFDRHEVARVIREARPQSRFDAWGKEHVAGMIGAATPTSYDNLDIVWDLNLWALPY